MLDIVVEKPESVRFILVAVDELGQFLLGWADPPFVVLAEVCDGLLGSHSYLQVLRIKALFLKLLLIIFVSRSALPEPTDHPHP
jgi:hypothetical protein